MNPEELENSLESEEIVAELPESVADKAPEASEEIKYSKYSILDVLSDVMFDASEDQKNILDALYDQGFSDKDEYTPEEIDNILSNTILEPDVLTAIEDGIIAANDTNVARTERFNSDIDDDIDKLQEVIDILIKYDGTMSVFASTESASKARVVLQKQIEKLQQLKNSFDGSFCVWENDIDKLNDAYNSNIHIVTLPDEEDA
jgi:hypothetical protein